HFLHKMFPMHCPTKSRAGGLRTETTINNTRELGIGKLLKNLSALRQIGFQANRRLLDVQKISHDCSIGEAAFDKVIRPIEIKGQRASALRFRSEEHTSELQSRFDLVC